MNQKPATAVVVNDDPTQLNVLTGLLQKEGLDATAFESAEAALVEMNAARPPDLIVTDLYMPGIDGWRFCRLLRSPEYEAFNAVPILVVSATFAGDEASGITADLGANAFLPSPVDGRRFIDTVRAVRSGEKPKESLRVLVVEDGRTLAGLLAKRFEEHGYQADVAFDCREASKRFTEAAYDIAVLDYHLPDGLGDALLQKFRMKTPNCVCVMITTDPDPKPALSWMKAGAAAYLRKPFDPEYLIEQCIRARRERALLRVEDLLEERTRSLRNRATEQRLLLDTIDTQVWYLTDTETYGRLNQSHADFLGLDVRAIVHKRLEEFVSKEAAEVCKASNIEVFQKKQPVHTEEWIPNADGEERLIAITKTPKLDANGKVEYVVCAGTDITDRVQAEEALREQLDFSESLIETAQAIILVLDTQGRIVRFNSYMEDLVGYDLDEVKGKDWFETFIKPENGNTVKSVFQKAIDDIQTRGNINPIIAKDGRQLIIEWYDKTLKDKNGNVVGLLAIGQNITERKQAEAERDKLQAQLGQAQKMESVGRLAGGVAHDFNNMLSIILGNTEMAMEGMAPDDPLHANLGEIFSAAQRSSDITRQLLAFARKQTVAPEVIDLNKTVESMLKMLHRLIGEDIDMAWIPGEAVWPVKIDRAQIDQILANLCVNARDAIADVGKVTIETGNVVFDEEYYKEHAGFVPGEYTLLAVSDNGSGMDAETLENVFKPFFTTKESHQGTGLGLSTVYGALKQNNGFINVYSEPGKGTTFKIYLPRHAARAAETKESRTQAAERGSETILLVEDEPAILELTTMMLEQTGYKVLAAGTPGEAIALAREHLSACGDAQAGAGEIHLLMTDVVMPEMNGRDLAKNLLSLYPGLKRLFMSGYTANVIAHRGILDEGVQFIQKPFSREQLGAKVREALDEDNL